MTRIAVLDDYEGVAASLGDWAGLAGCETVFFADHVADRQALIARLEPFEVVVAMRERTPFPAELLAQLPRLRLLVSTGARNRAIDVAAATRQGIVVCGTEGLPFPAAELTWGLILALARNIPACDAAMHAGGWPVSVGTVLAGRTLGLLGLGRLGQRVARVAHAFEMQVIAASPNLTPERAAAGGATFADLETLLRTSDFVSVHLALGPGTRGLLGRREFALMKREAYLINTSRGPIVDEAAMIEALSEGRLAGAALDVFSEEPLPPDHPLRRLPNVVLTPHVGYVVKEAYELFFRQVVEDIAAFRAGHPIRLLTA